MEPAAITDRVTELVSELARRSGLDLFDVQYRPERGRMVLRLLLDRPGGRVSLDELADFSRLVGDVLDAGDVVPGRYQLECSSPGVERPLRSPSHFHQAVGQRIRLLVVGPDGSERLRLRGVLSGVDAGGVTVDDDDTGPQTVAFEHIVEARTEFDAAQALAAARR